MSVPAAAAAALCLAALVALDAAPPPCWGGLEPGPYGVGCRVIRTFDRSRQYRPLVDFEGNRATGETARPMQIEIFYPADTSAPGAKRMTYGDYVDLAGTELGDDADAPRRLAYTTAELRAGAFHVEFPPRGPSDDEWRRMRENPVAAVRDAEPLAGPFPVVLHSALGGPVMQSVRMEYLASHGYVVASVPLLNTGPAYYRRGEWTAPAMEAAALDLGFVHALLFDLPFANARRAAVVGQTAHSGVIYAMRSMAIDALVLLDGQFPPELARSAEFDPTRFRVPVLDFANAEMPRDLSLLDALRYAERWRVEWPEAKHAHFYQFARVARPERAREGIVYEVAARVARLFLDATLKDDAAARETLRGAGAAAALGATRGRLAIDVRPAIPPPPTEAEFLALVREGKVRKAAAAYEAAKEREPDHRIFAAEALGDVAAFLLRDGETRAAIDALKLLADAYPDSPDAHARLGDAHARAGQRAFAIASFERQVEILEKGGGGEIDPEERRRSIESARERVAALRR